MRTKSKRIEVKKDGVYEEYSGGVATGRKVKVTDVGATHASAAPHDSTNEKRRSTTIALDRFNLTRNGWRPVA